MIFEKIILEEIEEYMQPIVEEIAKKVKADQIHKTDKGVLILEDTNLGRVYVEIIDYDLYDGLTLDEIKEIISYFNIKDPHVFTYHYSHTDTILCIGKIEENEVIY